MPSPTSWIWIYLLQHPKVFPKWWTGYLEVKEGFLSASHCNCSTLQRTVKCSVGQWERASILLWLTGRGTCLGGWEWGSCSASAVSLCGSAQHLENKLLCTLYKGSPEQSVVTKYKWVWAKARRRTEQQQMQSDLYFLAGGAAAQWSPWWLSYMVKSAFWP